MANNNESNNKKTDVKSYKQSPPSEINSSVNRCKEKSKNQSNGNDLNCNITYF